MVNEAFNWDGTLYSSIWSTVIGPDFIAIALRAARQADPTAKLYIVSLGGQLPSASAETNMTERL